MEPIKAPQWQSTGWLNTPEPLSLDKLSGRVILLHAFQMLCPGCVSHGIPQAQRVADTFAGEGITVVGLHTVFEHHEAMQLESLKAFVHEYRIRFPVGVDMPGAGGNPIPQTMQAYGMRGTPTTILIDARGLIRAHLFGEYPDMLLGAQIKGLLMESKGSLAPENGSGEQVPAGNCGTDACATS